MPKKCPIHKTWMKRNRYRDLVPVCEPCRMEAEKLQKEREKLTGSSRLPIKVIKL